MNKGRIVENMSEDMAYLIHVGLRKWCEDPQANNAWKAISEMEDDAWINLCKNVAEEIYIPMRKAFKKQFNE